MGDDNGLCHNKTVIRRYGEDKLNYYGGLKIRMGMNFMSAMHQLKEKMSQITIPILNVHGAEDPICSPQGSQQLNAGVSSVDKTLMMLPGVLHEPHNESSHLETLSAIIAWVEERNSK